MRRRDCLALLAAGAAWPALVRAQQRSLPVVGFINPRKPEISAPIVAAFRAGLKEAGYVEGESVAVEYRWAEDHYERLPALAADLVARRVDVILAGATASARAAKAASKEIPIVFTTALDPVALGVVPSLARPGGNITGVSFYSGQLFGKQLELLREMVPNASEIGLLTYPNNPMVEGQIKDAEAAAARMGVRLRILRVGAEPEFDGAIAPLAATRRGALFLAIDPFFDSRPDRVVAAVTRQRVPALYYLREFVAAGGLMSYGASLADAYRQAGLYAGKILGGAKPADLPVLQPTKFELAINRKTAKALDLAVPSTLLVRADEVIE